MRVSWLAILGIGAFHSFRIYNKQIPFFLRRSKTIAVQHLAESAIAAPSSEDSDDSILGEHSPFVKHTVSRQR